MYLELEKFDECITDCDRAIELNKDFSKVRKVGEITVRHITVKHQL